MSVCDPKSPDACEKCRPVDSPQVTNGLTPEQVREYEDLETQLKALRLEARVLAKSGNPAAAATGRTAEAKCNDDLAWVRSLLSKED